MLLLLDTWKIEYTNQFRILPLSNNNDFIILSRKKNSEKKKKPTETISIFLQRLFEEK